MKLAEHAVRMGEEGICRGLWLESKRERNHQEHLGVGGGIILKRVFIKWDDMVWTGVIRLSRGTSGGVL